MTHCKQRTASLVGLVALAGCGMSTAASTSDAPDLPDASCSTEVGPIEEGVTDVPYEARISHTPFAGRPMGVTGFTPSDSAQSGLPASFDGLALVALLDEPTYITAAYADRFDPAASESEFLSSGGVLLTRTDSNGDSIADDLKADRDTRDQISVVDVGQFRAAVAWADPDERGVREHHVLWTDGFQEVNVSAVRDPAELVAASRQWVCGF